MTRIEYVWPQAAAMEQQFRSIASSLGAQRDAIASAATAALSTGGESGANLGEYCIDFDDHVSMWKDEAKEIVLSFSNFLSELDSRIERANNLASLWDSRKNITRLVED